MRHATGVTVCLLLYIGIREKAAKALEVLKTPVSCPTKAKLSVGAEQEMESLFSFQKKRRLGKTPLSSK